MIKKLHISSSLNLILMLATGVMVAHSIAAHQPLKLEPIRQIYQYIGLDGTGTLEDLNKIGQDNLLRKPGVERWQMEDSEHNNKRDKVVALLKDAGFLKECAPEDSNYDYVIIMGAREKEMAKRIKYAEQCLSQTIWQRMGCFLAKCGALVGISAPKPLPIVVGLASSRPIDPAIETLRFGNTEAAVMKGLLKESQLANYPTQIIDVPMKIDANGKVTRPNTDDTIYAWLATSPATGKCLVVSSQPYVQRQTKILHIVAPADFTFEGVGPAVDGDDKISVYLDELARTIFQEKKLYELHPEFTGNENKATVCFNH